MKIIQVGMLTLGLISLSVQAKNESQTKWEPGFSGRATVIAGVIDSDSQADSGNDRIDSLDEKAERKTKGFAFPIAASHISYTFASGNQKVTLGTANADIALGRPHLELGYSQYIDRIGTLSLSYLPGLIPSTTWEDPLLVGEDRQETDRTIQGLRFQYTDILDSGFGLEVSVGQKDIDNESSASQYSSELQQQLNRNGDIYFAEFSHAAPVYRALILRSSVAYLRQDNDGSATSSNSYTGQLALLKFFKSATMTFSAKYTYSDFDDENPIFLDTRRDNTIGLFATYSYKDAFKVNGLGLSIAGGYSHTDSNIDFYGYDSFIAFTGVSYSF